MIDFMYNKLLQMRYYKLNWYKSTLILGTPWSSHAWNSAYNMHAKSTMLMLLKYAQETLGCELIASGDFSSKLAFEEERAYS